MCLKTEWLFYLHFLFYYTIQESSLDIHLVYLPLRHCSQSKDCSDGSVSGYRCKGLFIVYSLFLRESLSHKSCLILFNATVCSMLDLIVPLEVITNFPSRLGTATQTSFFIIDGSWHSVSSSQILGTSISSIDIFIAGTNVVVLL